MESKLLMLFAFLFTPHSPLTSRVRQGFVYTYTYYTETWVWLLKICFEDFVSDHKKTFQRIIEPNPFLFLHLNNSLHVIQERLLCLIMKWRLSGWNENNRLIIRYSIYLRDWEAVGNFLIFIKTADSRWLNEKLLIAFRRERRKLTGMPIES